jgi:hypothetical protein
MPRGSSASGSCVAISVALLWLNVEASRQSTIRHTVSDVVEELEDYSDDYSETLQHIADEASFSALEMNSTDTLSIRGGKGRGRAPLRPRPVAHAPIHPERSRTEDVECWCVDRYEFVDFDDYGPGGASSGDFSSIESCVMGSSRCNEICERHHKHILSYEGKSQTLSFCGSDNGFLDTDPQCHCLDSDETFKHSNKKKALQKGGSPNSLSQFLGAKEYAFDHYGSNAMNLAACYLGCPALCAKKQKLTGGCAMPKYA